MLKHLSFGGFVLGVLFVSGQICNAVQIKYDNGTPSYVKGYDPMWPSCGAYYGVRFTPTGKSNSKVTGAQVYIANQSGSSATFEIYVYDDNGGEPGTLKSQGTFNVGSSGGYFSPTLSTQPVIAGDFYIFIGPEEMDAYLGIGIDNGLNYDDRMGVADNLPSWYCPGYPGDFVLRANVTYVGVEENTELALGKTELKISPNPIVNNGTISYSLKQDSKVELDIYDLSGKLVKTFDNSIQTTGTKTINWDAKDNNGRKVSSGMYFCKLRIGKDTLTKTLVVL